MRIGMVAGEASGDLLGAGLMVALRAIVPEVQFEGVAGPAMRAAGCDVIENSDVLSVMGLIEPIREIPRLLRLRRQLVSRWRQNPPDVVVGIDSPDFNLGLERKLRQSGIRTVHYVSPSVWAWRQGRIRNIRKAVDRVLCLLPFEKQFYDDHDVPADFVGHPMAERITEHPDVQAARRSLELHGEPVVAVLPGSRRAEVVRLGGVFAEACALLAADPATSNVTFVASLTTQDLKTIFVQQLSAAGILDRFSLLEGDAELAITAADIALLTSGTVALEAALLKTPVVAAYKVSALTYAIARSFRLIKTPFITLPNLLTDQPLIPELIQYKATPLALKAAVSELLLDAGRRESIVQAFSGLRGQLARGADQRAAQAILSVASQRQAGKPCKQ